MSGDKKIKTHVKRPASNLLVYISVIGFALTIGGGFFWGGHVSSRVESLEKSKEKTNGKVDKANERLRRLEQGQERIENEQKNQKEDSKEIKKKVEEGNKKLDQLKDLLIRRNPN